MGYLETPELITFAHKPHPIPVSRQGWPSPSLGQAVKKDVKVRLESILTPKSMRYAYIQEAARILTGVHGKQQTRDVLDADDEILSSGVLPLEPPNVRVERVLDDVASNAGSDVIQVYVALVAGRFTMNESANVDGCV
jgi:hypothetical protein